MNRLLIALSAAALISSPTLAQDRELQSGLNYTTLGAKKFEKAKPAAETSIGGEDEVATDPATRVWNTYKDLATGQAAKDEKEEPEEPKTAEAAPEANENEEAAAPTNSFTAILEQWRSSKDSQREMRSKTFKTPARPTKPVVESIAKPDSAS